MMHLNEYFERISMDSSETSTDMVPVSCVHYGWILEVDFRLVYKTGIQAGKLRER